MNSVERPVWAPARQCTAASRAGDRCKRQPIPGGSVCSMHGGAIPNVQAAAKRRLLAMVEPILDAFEEILETWRGTRCETCGRPTGDPMPVIRVGQLVLDRSGFHPTLSVEHAAPPPRPLAELSIFEMADRAEKLARTTRGMADAETAKLARADRALVDGVILDDDEPIQESTVTFPEENRTDEGEK